MKFYVTLFILSVISTLSSSSEYDDDIEINRNFYQEEIEKNLEDLMLTGQFS
jgi:hypothetical protein